MTDGARRLSSRPWRASARRALRAAARVAAVAGALWPAVPAMAQGVQPDPVIRAQYGEPTARYAHGVLGDALEWGTLELSVDTCPGCAALRLEKQVIRLPETRVFEDLTPRIVEIDATGRRAALVVESDLRLGARMALYDGGGLVAATPFIGQSNRWLAPIGAGDLDGDGAVEFAYIDRPHLAKTLRIWRFEDGALREVATLSGLTNHRIGWDHIPGGLRDCGAGPELIVASGDWREVRAIAWTDGAYRSRALGTYSDHSDLARALDCAFP